MSTGFARLASAGSSSASFEIVSGESSESSRPAASQASEQRIPSPPAFVRIATRRPRGNGWVESSAAASINSSSVVARSTPAWWKRALNGLLGARECGGVRARGAGPGSRGPALHGENRLLARDAARDPAEPPGIAERLEVERDQAGLGVLLPVLEQVVGRDVGLVADRDERGKAETALGCLLEESEAECPALGGEADRPGRQGSRAEGRVQRRGCNRDPEAVGADESPAVRADGGKETLLPLATLGARLCKARGDHAERADPGAERRLGSLDDVRRRQADDGEVDGSGSSSIDVYARTPATGSPLLLTGNAAPLKSPARMFLNRIPPIDSCRGDAPMTATLVGAKNGRSDATTPGGPVRRRGRGTRRWARSGT